jgi:hypothetical protein
LEVIKGSGVAVLGGEIGMFQSIFICINEVCILHVELQIGKQQIMGVACIGI